MGGTSEDGTPLDGTAGAPEPLLEFAAVMRRLRAECPWKASQTHRSLARYLLEETWETLEAIDSGAESGDWDHLREELGDLLLQVYFHAVVAEESGAFTLDDVAKGITEKMVRRNPHVFGETAGGPGPADSPGTPAAVNELWESVKAAEKQRSSPFDGLPPGLPALLLADKVLDRLERAGRPADAAEPDAGRHGARSSGRPAAMTSGEETVPEPAMTSEELGERLLALVAAARDQGLDAEQSLRDAVRRRA